MTRIHVLAEWSAVIQAYLPAGTGVRAAPEAETDDKAFRHHDWLALVTRFTQDSGVDYRNFRRVRRLVEEYLSRLSYARPETWASRDERLAFYLNAYNAIAVHQVLLHGPTGSIRDIPAAFARPYPIGRELLTLNLLLHRKIREFGDPRVHAAVVPASASAPRLRGYTGTGLQQELDEQLRAFLADPERGMKVDPERRTVALSSIFRHYAGDFGTADRMPSLSASISGYFQPSRAIPFLRPYMPAPAVTLLDEPGTCIVWLPFRWELNASST